MIPLLVTVLVLLYIQALLTGIAIGVWLTSRKTKNVQTDINHIQTISPAIPNKEKPQPEKHIPTSTVSKFPNPELMRKKKDQDQLKDYLDDMRTNERPKGSFVL